MSIQYYGAEVIQSALMDSDSQWFLVSEVKVMRLGSTFTRGVKDETGLFSTLCIKVLCYFPLFQEGKFSCLY